MRAWGVSMILAVCSGCMTFDDLFFNPTQVDAYSLDGDIIPAELVEEVAFQTRDGETLYGVWARQDEPSPPLVYFHGNTGSIDDAWERVEAFWRWGGHDVFVFDYRGYGKSSGAPSFEGVLEIDGEAAATYVLQTTGALDEQALWMGHSLGGAVALRAAAAAPPAALVTEATFATASDIIDASIGLSMPSGWFFEHDFENLGPVAAVHTPILIVHGLADDYIDPRSADLLFEAAHDPKELWLPEEVGHSDIFEIAGQEYRDRVSAFVDRWAGAPPP